MYNNWFAYYPDYFNAFILKRYMYYIIFLYFKSLMTKYPPF